MENSLSLPSEAVYGWCRYGRLKWLPQGACRCWKAEDVGSCSCSPWSICSELPGNHHSVAARVLNQDSGQLVSNPHLATKPTGWSWTSYDHSDFPTSEGCCENNVGRRRFMFVTLSSLEERLSTKVINKQQFWICFPFSCALTGLGWLFDFESNTLTTACLQKHVSSPDRWFRHTFWLHNHTCKQ